MLKSVRLPSEAETDYTHHPIVKFTSRFFPIYPYIENQNFFVKKTVEEEGSNLAATRADSEDNTTAKSLKWHATPLFLCLIVMELVDVVFAFDSVPAIFAITEKSFLVYTSSIFAILGLRSLYFLIAAAKKYLCHLEKSVVAILLFIGGEMILEFFELIEIKPLVSLGVITGIIAAGVVTSLVGSFRKRATMP
jgi:tellurite resistance protein TerC